MANLVNIETNEDFEQTYPVIFTKVQDIIKNEVKESLDNVLVWSHSGEIVRGVIDNDDDIKNDIKTLSFSCLPDGSNFKYDIENDLILDME